MMILLNGVSLFHFTLIAVIAVHFCSSLTDTANATVVTLSKLVATTELNEAQKVDFIFSMTQIRSRNLNIQNIFFKINWNVLLTVRND